MKTIG